VAPHIDTSRTETILRLPRPLASSYRAPPRGLGCSLETRGRALRIGADDHGDDGDHASLAGLGSERRSATLGSELLKTQAREGVTSPSDALLQSTDEAHERLDTPERAHATPEHLPGGAALMRSGPETS
jgi:hypothetical protein